MDRHVRGAHRQGLAPARGCRSGSRVWARQSIGGDDRVKGSDCADVCRLVAAVRHELDVLFVASGDPCGMDEVLAAGRLRRAVELVHDLEQTVNLARQAPHADDDVKGYFLGDLEPAWARGGGSRTVLPPHKR